MRYSGIFIILVLFGSIVYSQNASKIDSLKRELKHSKSKSKIYNALAIQYIRVSPDECMSYAQQACYWASKEGDKTQMAKALWLKGRVYGSNSEYDRSIIVYDSAMVLFKELNDDENIIDCQMQIGTCLMLQGKYNEAIEMFDMSLAEAKRLNASELYAKIQFQIGRIHRVRGNFKNAIACYEDALRVGKEIKSDFLLANAYYLIGEVYMDKKNLEMAIEYFITALPLYEKQNLLTHIPYVYTSLGSAYRDSKNYSESLRYFRKASKGLTSLNDRWGLYELNLNIGITYMELNKLDSAKIHFEYSLTYCREINETAGESLNLKYLGEILIMQEEYEKSIEYLQEAQQLNDQINNKLGLTNILYNLGRANVYMGDYREGLSLLKSGLALADSLDVIYEKMIIHKEISTAYLKQDKYREAMKHFEIYSTLKDSVYKTESNRHFVEMEQKYQSEKQKQEISQLSLDKIEQDLMIRKQRSVRNIFILGFLFASLTGFLFYRSFRARKKADMEKEALLKEIHHRVKNNLQIISSLLSIQTDSVTDTKVINAVQESQGRVQAMALIHQLLYQNQDLSSINFETYLPQLVDVLSSIYKKEDTIVTTEIEAENISFDIDLAIPLGLIVTELAANAFKYAFNSKEIGKLSVRIHNTKDEEYLLTLTDNGPGLPQGIKVDELNSMGLRLVTILTDQLDGTFEYNYNLGATFTVKFKVFK